MRPGPARVALQNPDFRRLWLAHGISQVGDSLTALALLLTVNRLSGSASMIATLSVVLSVPQLGLGLFAGVMVDRWDRRWTMLVSDLARGALVLGFVMVRDPRDLWLLYVLGLVQATVGVFFNPARSALTPRVVEPGSLLAANSLLQTTQLISGLVGTALAGILFSLTNSGWPAFVIDSATFFVSAACVFGIRPQPPADRHESQEASGIFLELRQGLLLVLRTRALLAVLVAFAVACLGTGAVTVLFVPFLVNTLHAPAATLGLAKAAQLAGLLLGGAWAARRAVAGSSTALIGGGLAGIGIATVLLGMAPNLGFVLGWLLLLGLCATPMQSATNALLQARTPDALRGRVEAAVDTLLTGVMMVSMTWAGILADRIGVRTVLEAAGVLCIAGGAVGWALLGRADGPQGRDRKGLDRAPSAGYDPTSGQRMAGG
jgi:MFS family permease